MKRCCAQCSSGMRYRNVEFLVSILYYSSRGVQPRKPFGQEISRKKDRAVFQCPPYIFPYLLSPYIMHVLWIYFSAVYSTFTWYQLRSTACMYCCTEPDLRSVPCLFCACLFFLIDCHFTLGSLSLVTIHSK